MSKAEQMSVPEGDGLSHLYRRYSVWLTRRLRTRVAADVADDVVQETYLKIASRTDGDIRHPKAYLMQIALNVVRDTVRRDVRRDKASPPEIGADTTAASVFDRVLLGQIVKGMPQLYRDVFVLSRFAGMTYPEIARSLGVSVKTIEWRMARALEYCASRLDL
ncbi:RNA polymerase sigma factor [Brevundimonas sp. FT23042]|uniref:RNA polymerase sigma factor n=1 Tax=Brevundimonas sp. FT23042 TaxID=3393749 RepID=UPI003B587C89